MTESRIDGVDTVGLVAEGVVISGRGDVASLILDTLLLRYACLSTVLCECMFYCGEVKLLSSININS